MFIFILVLLVGIVSSFEFDNIKRYDAETKTITIINAFGLGEDLEKAKLINNTYNCEQSCSAYKEITLFKDGVLIQDLNFYRLFTDGSRELSEPKRYTLKYYIDFGDTFYIDKETLKNGTIVQETQTIFRGEDFYWVTYELGTEVKAGTYQVRLEGTKKVNRIYDWIITLQGRELTEWATWGNISLGDDGEVLLISPEDNITKLIDDPISYNATANITGGDTLTNVSLYDDSSGTWKLNETITIPSSSGGDVGEAAIDRAAAYGPDLTLLNIGNPASTNFTCTEANIWVIGTAINVKVGSFFGSGDTWENRDSAALGAISTGSLVTVTGLSIEFQVGDVIGMFDTAGGSNLEADVSGGSNIRYLAGDQFGTGEQGSYILLGSDLESLNCSAVASSSTFTAQNFSKNVLRETTWNVQACDSSGTCGFATSNRTVRVLPQINVFSPTNSTFTTSTIFFNATNSSSSVDTWIVNYNGTNVTLSDINTTLEVEDGNKFNLK